MEFDIRAISLVESIGADARVEIGDLSDKEVSFRRGIQISITLPELLEECEAIPEAEKILTAFAGWARVYRYPELEQDRVHVLATAEDTDRNLHFYKVDLTQPRGSRRGVRPAVRLDGATIMSYGECAGWLVELAYSWAVSPDPAKRRICLSRPCPVPLKRIRTACVCPEILGTRLAATRLGAIGQVFGAEILQISPRHYRDVEAQIASANPDTVMVCRHFAPYITESAVPACVPRDLIHFCDSSDGAGIEEQLRTWIELSQQRVSANTAEREPDREAMLLALMLGGMVSHSKIGQFSHCQKATVLTRVRARHLDVATAEYILDENSELYQETRTSESLFLWKEHNDGRQYFLNPKAMENIRQKISAVFGER